MDIAVSNHVTVPELSRSFGSGRNFSSLAGELLGFWFIKTSVITSVLSERRAQFADERRSEVK